MGSTRTSPVNDLNVQFGGIVFSNTTAICNAPFTLKGAPIHISYGPKDAVPGVSQNFGIWPMASSGTLTDTIEADIVMASSQKLGCYNASGHNLIFKGAGTGTGTLQTMDQYKGALTFEGPVTGFSSVLRPNGNGGTITLKSSENVFTGNTHSIGEGGLTISGAGALGGAEMNVTLGQIEWNTPAALTVNATSDTLFTFNSVSGSGCCIPGDNLPPAAVLTLKPDRVTLSIASEQLVWKGDAANNVWDATTANWQGGALFTNGKGVTFDDSGNADATDIVVAAGIQPQTVMVAGSQNNYTFTGEGLSGFGNLSKSSGTSVLTLANAAFTNTVTGRISGNARVDLAGRACELNGTNDFTGGLYITAPYVESSNTTVTVLNAAALGAGTDSLRVLHGNCGMAIILR